MGQRVHPDGFRLGVSKVSHSRWFTTKIADYSNLVKQDYDIRSYLEKKFRKAGISKIVLTRTDCLTITMYVGMVGMVIGKKGAIIDALKNHFEQTYICEVKINVKEVKKLDTDGPIVANNIAMQLEGRSSGFKNVVKRVLQSTMGAGAKGIRVMLSGRLGGAEIARAEEFFKGSVPLQTLQADISYGSVTAHTTAGAIGVKVWIYRGINRRKYNPFEGMGDKFSKDANMEHNRNNEKDLNEGDVNE